MALNEELDLTIDAALSNIDTVGNALSQVASQFKVDLADALDVLQNVQVEADASAVAAEVESALSDAPPVIVEADTSAMVEEVETAISDQDVLVTVEADTTQAQEAIEALGQESVTATASVEGLESAAAGAGVTADLAGGGFAGLGSAIGSINPAAAGGVAAAAAIGASIGGIFNDAVAASGAVEAFNESVGAFAADVRDVNVAGLNTDLADLATTLGSDDEALLTAAQSLFQLGVQGGATGAQAAQTANQVAALAANAVALKPSLGEVGAVQEQLTKALARGGRALTPFGISLSSAEVNARALADTGKKTADELTQFDKITAASSISLDKFGSSIAGNIEKGAKNSIITLNRLKEQVTDTIEDIGLPLIQPIFALMEAIQPLTIGIAGIIASIGTTVVPVITGIVNVVGPVLSAIITAVQAMFDAVQPVFIQLGSVIGALAPVFTPVIAALQFYAGFVQTVVVPVTQFFADALEGIALTITTILGPLDQIAGLFGTSAEETSKAAAATKEYEDGLAATTKALDLATQGVDDNEVALAKLLLTNKAFAGAQNTAAFKDQGLSITELNQQLADGDAGFKRFVASGVAAGQIRLFDKDTGLEQTSVDIENVTGNLSDLVNAGELQITQGRDQAAAFLDTAGGAQAQAQAANEATERTLQLTEAQKANIAEQLKAQGLADTAVNRQTIINQQLAAGTIGVQSNTNAVNANAASYVALQQAVATGQTTLQDAAAVATQFNIPIEQATQLIKDSQKAVEDYVAAATAKLPTVSTVFQGMAQEIQGDASTLAFQLNTATAQILTFGTNLGLIDAAKFPEVLDFLRRQGPEAAGALAQSFVTGTETQRVALEESIKANKAAGTAYANDTRASIGENVAAATDLAKQSSGALGKDLKFEEVTRAAVFDATKVLTDGKSVRPMVEGANHVGEQTGTALVLGMAAGIFKGTGAAESAARDAILRMQRAANETAQVQSPSKLFAEIGFQLSAGLALGIDSGTSDVVAAAEEITRAAANAAVSTQPSGGAPQVAGAPVNIQIVVNASGDATPEGAQALATTIADTLAVTLADLPALVAAS